MKCRKPHSFVMKYVINTIIYNILRKEKLDINISQRKNMPMRYFDTHPEHISIKKLYDDVYNIKMLIPIYQNDTDTQEKSRVGLVSLICKQMRFNYDFESKYDLTQTTTYKKYRSGVASSHILCCLPQTVITGEYVFKLKTFNNTEIEYMIKKEGDNVMNYNLYEGLEDYKMEINVAGYSKSELDITVEDEVIYVRTGMLLNLDTQNVYKCLRKEIKKEITECEIYIPNAEADNIDARIDNGILYISVPKKVKGKKVEIK